jgi:hypothetical protein
MFAKIAGDDMEVDAHELHEILNFSLKKGKRSSDYPMISRSIEATSINA